uniref:Uncharacterized protein n=1 Tax=Arundo donax TaxID=35708 RepID=A0A0A9G7P5_ARUDO
MRPACSQVQLSSRHAWFPCTTFCQSRPPYLCSVAAEGPRRGFSLSGWKEKRRRNPRPTQSPPVRGQSL